MCIIAEDIAFINHACEQHANRWPAVWKAEEDVGSVQWQLATVKRGVRAGRSSSCAMADTTGTMRRTSSRVPIWCAHRDEDTGIYHYSLLHHVNISSQPSHLHKSHLVLYPPYPLSSSTSRSISFSLFSHSSSMAMLTCFTYRSSPEPSSAQVEADGYTESRE
jgi:hypothetical protein